MGRKCAVPHCYTGYRKCREKASLYRVPDDDFFLSKWQEAIAREDRPITPKDYVCEKHFKDDDIMRRRIIKDVIEEYQRPRLKPDAIPSIFPDLPEYILKMVKKRRKMPLEDQKFDLSINIAKAEQEHNLTQEIKTEPTDTNGNDDLVNSVCETILNNELHIKSEPEDGEYEASMEIDEDNEQDCDFGPKMHQCDECDYQTIYPHNLRTHKTKHLTGDETYMYCEHCPKFKTRWEVTYRNHMKIKHGIGKQQVFRCNLCLFETKVKLCLKRHYERHQRDSCENILSETPKSFKCTDCFFETNSKGHISRHVKTAHNTGDDTMFPSNSNAEDKPMYKCLKCSYKSKSQNYLLKHALEHKYQTSGTVQPKTKSWKCPICPSTTFCQHLLQEHQATGCGRLLTCNKCNFKSNYKTDFLKHLLAHRNISFGFINQELFGMSSTLRCDNLVDTRLERMMNEEMVKGANQVNMNPEFVVVKNEILDV